MARFNAKLFRTFEFSQIFFRFLLLDRIMIQKDNLVLITGKRGDGKTTLALKIILGFANIKGHEEYYNEQVNKFVDEDKKKNYSLESFTSFDMMTHMAFTRKDLQELCKNNTRGFILADEAIVNAARRNAMTKANKILHEVLTINRKNMNTVFFCLPSIEDFDVSILQYVTHWIHIDDRGLGCILLPEAKSIFGRKTWDVDKMKKTFDKFREDNPTVISVPYWLFDNFRGYIRFKALGKNIEKSYLDIAHAKKNLDTEEEEVKPKVDKNALPSEKVDRINAIADELISGKLIDSADYYSVCAELELTKDKLNREVNKKLLAKGDGRTAYRILRENKKADDDDYERRVQARKIIY